MKLTDWAKQNNVAYHTAYQQYKRGKLPVRAYKTVDGIFVDAPQIIQALEEPPKVAMAVLNLPEPLAVNLSEQEAFASTRQNRVAIQPVANEYANIWNGMVPFKYGTASNTGCIDARETILLCQKAYYNFAIFRNTIDLMTEFSVSKIYFTGGNKASRDFFQALYEKLNLLDFQDKFFREYYRSGNVFIYRFDGNLKDSDLKKITQNFGVKAAKTTIPLRYMILNPYDIQVSGSASFVSGIYRKILTDYEIERLKNPRTPEDQQILKSLPPEAKDLITQKHANAVIIDLPADKIYAVFYKKQDYEALATPMGFPVLKSINWKAEMQKMDMMVGRTLQQAILLITMGTEPDKGGVNPKNIDAMRMLFENESVARVLVADYTTKAQFIIPDLADLFDPKKYAVVNEDIRMGLNNVLIGNDEKFASASIKTDIFVQRLKRGRDAFLDSFLIPEIKRIAKDMGFRDYPTPNFEDIDLRDETEMNRIWTQLATIGFLTPAETFEAIKTGTLPTKEDSAENQQEFADQKNNGLYEPVAGGIATQKELASQQSDTQLELANRAQDTQLQLADKAQETAIKTAQMKPAPSGKTAPVRKPKTSKPAGRPAGTKRKQSTKKVSPVGASTQFSLARITELMKKTNALGDLVTEEIGAESPELTAEIVETIIANEEEENWEKKVKEYCENPKWSDKEVMAEINEIAAEYGVTVYLAALLYHSQE